jgi:hypothetical protein
MVLGRVVLGREELYLRREQPPKHYSLIKIKVAVLHPGN